MKNNHKKREAARGDPEVTDRLPLPQFFSPPKIVPTSWPASKYWHKISSFPQGCARRPRRALFLFTVHGDMKAYLPNMRGPLDTRYQTLRRGGGGCGWRVHAQLDIYCWKELCAIGFMCSIVPFSIKRQTWGRGAHPRNFEMKFLIGEASHPVECRRFEFCEVSDRRREC